MIVNPSICFGRCYIKIDGVHRFWKYDVEEFYHVKAGGKTLLEIMGEKFKATGRSKKGNAS